ncbi:MAG: hypothetical protein ONB32_07390 [candidate division KSB1 bacterium]|nr:hypothetical protein [candidate division KSB1 bacterium]
MTALQFKINPNRMREFEFVPRIINPVKIHQAAIFSADEQLRNAGLQLQETMPWVKVVWLRDPISASNFQSDFPSVLIFDDVGMNLVNTDRIRRTRDDRVLVLATANTTLHCSPPSVAQDKFPYCARADLVFAYNQTDLRPATILPAIVRCAEDKLNIERYSKERRFIFLIVDDEPRWFSQFLPVLYEIIGQRADVMLTRTYEETLKFLFGVEHEAEIVGTNYHLHGHGDDVVCVISDFFFPKGDDLNAEAGRNLCQLLKRYYPRIPIIIASKAQEGEELRNYALIMPKGDIGSLDILKQYIHDYTGMGDFVIQNEQRSIYFRVKNIHQLYQVLVMAETDNQLRDLLEVYGEKDFFSTWLYMHGFRELGDKLRPKRDRGQRLVSILQRYIRREIIRMHFTPLLIDDIKIFTLNDLLHTLRTVSPEKIQYFSDNDFFSIWLDRKGYNELAEQFRPIHGSGYKLVQKLAAVVEKWIDEHGNNLKQYD